MKNFKRAVDRTVTTTSAGKINYLRTLLHGEELRELDKLSSQNSGTNNTHPKFIQEGFLRYPPPISDLPKQKRAMRCAMHKHRDISFKRFDALLIELNNYLPILPVSSATKEMPPEDLNKTLLHDVPNGWEKQAYIQRRDFDMKSYKATYERFEIMKIAEKIYQGGNTSKKQLWKTPTM